METPRTPDEWYIRDPRLKAIRGMLKAGVSTKHELAILEAVAQLIQKKIVDPTAPTSDQIASKLPPKSRFFSPAAAAALPAPAAPTRRPFEKALQTVCGSKPTMAKPWSMPDGAA